MSFMKPQIIFGDWWKVEDENGTTFLSVDLVGDLVKPIDFISYLESGKAPAPDAYEMVSGYGARLSTSGYLDCTPWVVFDFKEEAEAYLKEMYDVED